MRYFLGVLAVGVLVVFFVRPAQFNAPVKTERFTVLKAASFKDFPVSVVVTEEDYLRLINKGLDN